MNSWDKIDEPIFCSGDETPVSKDLFKSYCTLLIIINGTVLLDE